MAVPIKTSTTFENGLEAQDYFIAPVGGTGGGVAVGQIRFNNTTSPAQIEAWDGSAWVAASGGGGASDLEGLTDVNLGTPANDEALVYNTTSGEWENKPAVASPTSVASATKMRAHDDLDALKASNAHTIGFTVVHTQGYYDIGDGGQAKYRWIAASTATADDKFVILPTGHVGAGRWHLVIDDNTINLLQIGGKCNFDIDLHTPSLAFDNIPIFDAAFAFIRDNKGLVTSIRLPTVLAGTANLFYFCASPLTVRVNVKIFGDTPTTRGKLAFYQTAGLKFLYTDPAFPTWPGCTDFTLENIHCQVPTPSIYPEETDGEDGIYWETRGKIRNCYFAFFRGNGGYFYANVADGPPKYPTNGNLTEVREVTFIRCGKNGLEILGGDVNSSIFEKVDATGCKYWGIKDGSLLGVEFSVCHTNGNGIFGGQPTNTPFSHVYTGDIVSYDAGTGVKYYRALQNHTNQAPTDGATNAYWAWISNTANPLYTTTVWNSATAYTMTRFFICRIDHTNQPPPSGAAHNLYWTYQGTGDQWGLSRKWSAAQEYKGAGARTSQNINNKTDWIQCYDEGGQGHSFTRGGALTLAGSQDTYSFNESDENQIRTYQNRLWHKAGFMGNRFDFADGSGGMIGGDGVGTFTVYGGTYEMVIETTGAAMRWGNAANKRIYQNAAGNFVYGDPSAQVITQHNFSGDVAIINFLKIRVFGEGATVTRILGFANAQPATGNWTKGDFVFNWDPDTGETLGWRCTTGGSPGTWEAISVGGGGGASALNDLTDVTIASPSNGQFLKYNSTTSQWENQSGSAVSLTQHRIALGVAGNALGESAELTYDGSLLVGDANAKLRFFKGAGGTTPYVIVTGAGSQAAGLLAGTGASAFVFSNAGYFGIFTDTKANLEGGSSGAGTELARFTASGEFWLGHTVDRGNFIAQLGGSVWIYDKLSIGNTNTTHALEVTGTTKLDGNVEITGDLTGKIASGTYTPTLTNVQNVTGSTAYSCQYMRVGSVVTVSGRVDIDVTTGATNTLVGISLPIASDFTASNECAGTIGGSNNLDNGAIIGDSANNRAQVSFNPANTGARNCYFQFTYRII